MRRFIWLPTALLVVVTGVASPLVADDTLAKNRSAIVDLTAGVKGGVTTLFLVTRTGAVYTHTVGLSDNDVDLNSFQLIWQPKSPIDIAGIAHNDDSLLLSDKSSNSVLAISGETSVRLLRGAEGSLFAKPSALADGRVAIADANKSVALFSAFGSNADDVVTFHTAQPLTQVTALGRDLVGLTNEGSLVRLRAKPFEDAKQELAVVTDDRLDQLTRADSASGRPSTADAVTSYGGATYIAAGGHRTVLAGSNEGPSARLPDRVGMSRLNPAFDATRMYVFDDGCACIKIYPRFIPASIAFRNDTGENLTALVDLYEALDKADYLPLRSIKAVRNYGTLEDFLYEQRVLIPARAVHVEGEARQDDSAGRLRALLCKWNSGKCRPDSDILTLEVSEGDVFNVPSIILSSRVEVTDTRLRGRSIEVHLRERLSSPEIRRMWPTDRLVELNDGLFSTIEGAFNHLGFVAATPPSRTLRPGNTLTIDAGRDRVGPACRSGSLSVEAIELPDVLRSLSLDEFLPFTSGTQTSAMLEKYGVRSMEVGYDDPVREFFESRGTIPVCGDEVQSYVVTDAIRIARLRVRLLDDGGAVRRVSDRDLHNLGLEGAPDATHEWSFVAEGPFYVAYKIWAPPSLTGAGTWIPTNDVAALKPGASQDLLDMSKGIVQLPIERWRAAVALPLPLISSADSVLQQQFIALGGVVILPADDSSAKAMSLGNGDTTTTSALSSPDDLVRSAQAALHEAISFSPELTNHITSTVAVTEMPGSVDFHHPAFFSGSGTSVWYSIDETTGLLAPHTETPLSIDKPQLQNKEVSDLDHGTHIGGILVAQEGSLAPGLLPFAHLALIDLSSIESVDSGLQAARNRKVRVYGMSFGWTKLKHDSPLLRGPHGDMKSCSNCVYVVAAGDEGNDLRSVEPYGPIGWEPEFADHVIGVAALQDLKLLGDYSGASPRYQTNYGNRYVQLLAPGRDVYSTVMQGNYGRGSGSSQAVPQVAAAAAALAYDGRTAPQIKARLIYTSDVPGDDMAFDQNGFVWGGRLNMKRALTNPDDDVLLTQLFDSEPVEIELQAGMKLKVKGGRFNTPDVPPMVNPTHEIDLDNVLRIQSVAGRYRITYIDDQTPQMFIKYDVKEIDGSIPCNSLHEWNDTTHSFDHRPSDRLIKRCRDHSFSWKNVDDYVASFRHVPTDVKMY